MLKQKFVFCVEELQPKKGRARQPTCVCPSAPLVVFVTGVGAGVSAITREQAFDIYTGKIDNWRLLGAGAATIRAVGRE